MKKIKFNKQILAYGLLVSVFAGYVFYDNLERLDTIATVIAPANKPVEPQKLSEDYVNTAIASVKQEVYDEMDDYIVQYITENDITNYFTEETIQNLTQEVTNVIVSEDTGENIRGEFETLISDTIAQIDLQNYPTTLSTGLSEDTKAEITNQVATAVKEQMQGATFTISEEDKKSITSDLDTKVNSLESQVATILAETETNTKPVEESYQLSEDEMTRITEYVKSNLNISDEVAKYLSGTEGQEQVDVNKLKEDIASSVTTSLSEQINNIVKGEDGYTPIKGTDYFTSEEITAMVDEVASRVQNGADGADGADGYTPVKGVDYFTPDEINSIVEEIQSQVQSGADGQDGQDGHTPVKGVDYWTEQEVADIVATIQSRVTNGTDGSDGLSAYEIACEEGYTGTRSEWLSSLHGTNGYTPVKGTDYFTEAEVDDLKSDIISSVDAAYDSVIEDLQNQINAIDTQVDANKLAIDALNGELTTLSNELSTLSTDVTTNKSKIEEISTEITSVKSRITTLESATEELSNSKLNISEFNIYKQGMDSTIGTITGDINNLSTDLGSFKTAVNNHFDALDALVGTLATSSEVDEFKEQYTIFKDSVNAKIANLETSCSTLNNTKLNISDFDTYTATENAKIDNIIERLDNNDVLMGNTSFTTEDYSTVSDAIVSIQGEIDSFKTEYGNTVDLINEDIDTINSTLGTRTGLFADYTGTLWQLADSLQADINANKVLIDTNASEISSISSELTAFKNTTNTSLSNIDNDINDIRTELATKLDADTFTVYQNTVNSTLDSLQGSIDEIKGLLSQETTNRENADKTLTTAISNEQTARENADSTLTTSINNLKSSWEGFKGTSSLSLADIQSFMNSTNESLGTIKTNLGKKLNTSDVVNNLTSTSTTKPLSAAQGKALNDKLAKTQDLLYAKDIQLNNISISNKSMNGAYYSNEIQLGVKAKCYYSFMILDWNGVSYCFNFYHLSGSNTLVFFSDSPQTIGTIWIRVVYTL